MHYFINNTKQDIKCYSKNSLTYLSRNRIGIEFVICSTACAIADERGESGSQTILVNYLFFDRIEVEFY
jgi:hypothetical protein